MCYLCNWELTIACLLPHAFVGANYERVSDDCPQTLWILLGEGGNSSFSISVISMSSIGNLCVKGRGAVVALRKIRERGLEAGMCICAL